MRLSNPLAYVVALALVLGLGTSAKADPITAGDGWHAFSWTAGPNVFQTETPWTFNTAVGVDLSVTDAFVSGDRFEVYNFGVLVGTTSQINGFSPWTNDPNVAFLSSNFSTGVFSLAAGSYSLTFKNIQSPSGYASGAAFFRVDPQGGVAQVPEPASATLVALGVAGLAVGYRRRRKTAV